MQAITARRLPIRFPARDIVTIASPAQHSAPLPDHDSCLTPHNSVTVSHSSLPGSLPAGRYHYSLFSEIDIFRSGNFQTRQELEDQIESMTEHSSPREQLEFARHLIDSFMDKLSLLSKEKRITQKILNEFERIKEESQMEF